MLQWQWKQLKIIVILLYKIKPIDCCKFKDEKKESKTHKHWLDW